MAFVLDRNKDDIRGFDVMVRGAVSLVEQWKENHDEGRDVWKIEDLIAVYNDGFDLASRLLRYYQEHGQFPNAEFRFSYFADSIGRFLVAARELAAVIAGAEPDQYQVAGSVKFKAYLESFVAMLEEEGVELRAFSTETDGA